jgi:hypothetical protein
MSLVQKSHREMLRRLRSMKEFLDSGDESAFVIERIQCLAAQN